jgi:hypothetical protein
MYGEVSPDRRKCDVMCFVEREGEGGTESWGGGRAWGREGEV